MVSPERYAKGKLVEGYLEKSSILYTWLYHLTDAAEYQMGQRAREEEEYDPREYRYDGGSVLLH